MTRAEFEGLIQPILARTMGPVKMALADAKLTPDEIDEVVLVGGSTRIPLVRNTVGDYFEARRIGNWIQTKWWRWARRCRRIFSRPA